MTTGEKPNLAEQLSLLRQRLAPDQFRDESEAQALYPCPSSIRTSIIGVVYPQDAAQVQTIVHWAHEAGVALYPLSTGKNWGYGAGHPVKPESLIVDLGRINQIRSFDAELGIVEIEPGVSQLQLCQFLQAENAPFYTPATGSNPTCSLIGNALERGFGVAPVTDHFSAILSITAILPDGSLYQGPPADRAISGPCELDPHMSGLFSQSNMGIVIAASLQLARKAESHEIIMFGSDDLGRMELMVDAARELQIANPGITTSVKFFNLAYSVALNTSFPTKAYQRPDFDIAAWLHKVRKREKVPMWLGIIFLAGPDALVRKVRQQSKQRLKPLASKISCFNSRNIRLLTGLHKILTKTRWLPGVADKIDSLLSAYRLMQGIPQTRFLKAAYWRVGAPATLTLQANPGRDGAGLIWFAPIIPFRGEDLLRFETLVSHLSRQHKFMPVISITTISSRALSALVPILFDPATETERAHAFYAALMEACKEAGYLPYRGHIHYLDRYTDATTSPAWKTWRRIKRELDPKGTVAPGRYDGQSHEKEKQDATAD